MKRKITKGKMIFCIVLYVLALICLLCATDSTKPDFSKEMLIDAIILAVIATVVMVVGFIVDPKKIEEREKREEEERREQIRKYKEEKAEEERKKEEEWEKQMALAELERTMDSVRLFAQELADEIELQENSLVDLICNTPITDKMVCPYCKEEMSCTLEGGKIGRGTKRRQKGVMCDNNGNEKPVWEDYIDEIIIPVYRQKCEKCGLIIQGAGDIPNDVMELNVSEYVKRQFFAPSLKDKTLKSLENKIRKWKEKNSCLLDDFFFSISLSKE